MVSYCDRAVSVVLRAVCFVRRQLFYLVYALEATFSVQSSWNLVRMFVSIKSRMSSKLGHVGWKTRSLDQILEKPCARSRGHIFSPILMKLGQNVCLDEDSDEFKLGHVGSKTRSLGQILEKPCVRSRGHIFSPILMKLGQNVCLDKI